MEFIPRSLSVQHFSNQERNIDHAQRLPPLRTLIDIPTPRAASPQHTLSSRNAQTSQLAAKWHPGSVHLSPVSARSSDVHQFSGFSTPVLDQQKASSRDRPSSLPFSRPAETYGSHLTKPMASSPQPAITYLPAADLLDDRSAVGSSRTEINRRPGFLSYDRAGSCQRDSQHTSLLNDNRAFMASVGPAVVPRCVGQRHVQGKGLCYVYENGSFCEMIVRGEPVNPEWGLTRAGRARKRLAKACNSCREKKVKCETGGNHRCQRCTRKDQDCRWSHCLEGTPEREDYSAPAGDTLGAQLEPVYGQRFSPQRLPLTPPYTISSKNSHEPLIQPDPTLRQSSKRRRSMTPDYRHEVPVPIRGDCDEYRGEAQRSHRSRQDLIFAWDADPYHKDSVTASKLLQLYFDFYDNTVNCVLPRKTFWNWVRNSTTRSRDEKVVFYAVLALGSIFSPEPDIKDSGVTHASLACHGEKELIYQHNLPLALARLLLSSYYFAIGRNDVSGYYLHAGLRTLNVLQLNAPEGIPSHCVQSDAREFGFSLSDLAECSRRTFWLGYSMERYSCFTKVTQLNNIDEEDVFIHLPNDELQYQMGIDATGPNYDGGIVEKNFPREMALGSMAMSISIGSVWAEVVTETYRTTHRHSITDYERHHENFYGNTIRKLWDWEQKLPAHLRFSHTNTIRNIGSEFSTYFFFQCVHHTTALNLARFTRFHNLPIDIIRRNIRQAHTAAHNILSMVSILSQEIAMGRNLDGAFTHPFCGYAILCACDVISSDGHLDRDIQKVDAALVQAHTALMHMGTFFATAREQARCVEERRRFLGEQNLACRQQTWRCPEPLGPIHVRRDCDVIYGVNESLYHEVLAEIGGSLWRQGS